MDINWCALFSRIILVRQYLLVACLSSLLLVAPITSSAAPNIVVIMVDDLSKDAFDTLVQGGWMPNLKSKVIDKGVNFQNSFVTNSQCCPSRATFLTGQYSHNHAVYSNIGNHPLKAGITWEGWLSTATTPGKNESTIATWLEDAGYHTGYIGKYLNGYGVNAPEGVIDPQTYIPPGWTEWNGLIDPTTYQVYDYSMNQNGVVASYGSAEADYQTDVLAGIAVDFVNRAANNSPPFFLVIAPLAPHLEVIDPLQTLAGDGKDSTIRPAIRHQHLVDGFVFNGELPSIIIKPSFNEEDVTDKPSCPRAPLPDGPSVQFDPHCVADSAKSFKAGVLKINTQFKTMMASMIAVDDMIGGIVTALEQKNLLSNTVLIFASDNGWIYGEHRLIGKEVAYEESIRIPLVVSAPGGQVAVTSSKIVLNNDWAPTIAALAGVVPPYETDGVSMVPLFANPENTNWHRRFFLIERWFVTTLFKYEAPTFFAIRRLHEAQNYIFIATQADQSNTGLVTHHEFYELNSDPYQLQSIKVSGSVNRIFDNFLILFRQCKGFGCTALESL